MCGDAGWMKAVQGSRKGVTFGCGACKTRFFLTRYKGLLGFLVQRDFTINTGTAHLQAVMGIRTSMTVCMAH